MYKKNIHISQQSSQTDECYDFKSFVESHKRRRITQIASSRTQITIEVEAYLDSQQLFQLEGLKVLWFWSPKSIRASCLFEFSLVMGYRRIEKYEIECPHDLGTITFYSKLTLVTFVLFLFWLIIKQKLHHGLCTQNRPILYEMSKAQ